MKSESPIWGFLQVRGAIMNYGGPYNKDYNILGFILGSAI